MYFGGQKANTISAHIAGFGVSPVMVVYRKRIYRPLGRIYIDCVRAQERKTGHVDAMLCFLAFISAVHGDIETRFVDCPSGHVISSDAFSSQETTCPWTGLLLVES